MIKEIIASLLMLGTYNTQPIEQNVSNANQNTPYTEAMWDYVPPNTLENGYYVGRHYETDTTDYYNLVLDQYYKQNENPTITTGSQNGATTYGFGSLYLKIEGINKNFNTKIKFTNYLSVIYRRSMEIQHQDKQWLNVIIYSKANVNNTNSIYQYIENPLEIENNGYNYEKKMYQLYYDVNPQNSLEYRTQQYWEFDINIVTEQENEYLIYMYPEAEKLQRYINGQYRSVINQYTYNSSWLIGIENSYLQGINGAVITTEIIDMPNLMWTVLTMPFSFISIAFNLTLWPGTQYAVNIGTLFFAILGIMIFVFIMKIIIKAAASSGG